MDHELPCEQNELSSDILDSDANSLPVVDDFVSNLDESEHELPSEQNELSSSKLLDSNANCLSLLPEVAVAEDFLNNLDESVEYALNSDDETCSEVKIDVQLGLEPVVSDHPSVKTSVEPMNSVNQDQKFNGSNSLSNLWPTYAVSENPTLKEIKGPADLPIYVHRENIYNNLENNGVLCIMADTGSGKSTLLPTYFAERGMNNTYNYFIYYKIMHFDFDIVCNNNSFNFNQHMQICYLSIGKRVVVATPTVASARKLAEFTQKHYGSLKIGFAGIYILNNV